MVKKNLYVYISLALLFLVLVGVGYYALQPKVIRVKASTTTSLYATGLLEYLAKEFKKVEPNVEISYIPVGSGEALRLAKEGEVCMVFVHAPSLEKKYLEEGIIEDGKIFAYNYFIIVGPKDDPAKVREAKSAVDAFKRIYEAGEEGKAKFISRGDMSGTNVRELQIWKKAGLNPKGKKWYIESGSGMQQTLIMANELKAYTLSDIGTFLKLKKDGKLPNLEILYANGTELINIYSVYLVKSCKGKEREMAEKFANFVYTHQDLIGKYGVDKYGQPLFYPAKGKEELLRKYWEELSKG